MTSRDFCFWLQGYFELTALQRGDVALSIEQQSMIKQHLALVFKHEIDPSMGNAGHQATLNSLHMGAPNSELKCPDCKHDVSAHTLAGKCSWTNCGCSVTLVSSSKPTIRC